MRHDKDTENLLAETPAPMVLPGDHRERLKSQLLRAMREQPPGLEAPPKSRWGHAGAWAWGFAGLALFVFALSQTQFTLKFGGAQIEWGRSPRAGNLQHELASFEQQIAESRRLAEQNREVLAALQLENRRFQESVGAFNTQLVRQFQLETQTRYDDMRRLTRLSGPEGQLTREWLTSGAGHSNAQ